MKFLRHFFVAMLAFPLLTTQTHAALYTLAFDQSSYQALSGGEVAVNMLFRNTDATSTTDALFTEGLFSAGGRVLSVGGDAAVSLSRIVMGGGFSLTDSQLFPPASPPVPDAGNLAGVLAINGSFTQGVGVGQSEVLVATFYFKLTGNGGQAVILGLNQLDAASGFDENISFVSNTVLDSQLSSTFDTATLSVLAPSIPGDYNADGFVDAADYTVWADHFGSAGPAGDGNGDGRVDAADYTVWADHFGQGVPAVALPVPEPLGSLAAILVTLILSKRAKRD